MMKTSQNEVKIRKCDSIFSDPFWLLDERFSNEVPKHNDKLLFS